MGTLLEYVKASNLLRFLWLFSQIVIHRQIVYIVTNELYLISELTETEDNFLHILHDGSRIMELDF